MIKKRWVLLVLSAVLVITAGVVCAGLASSLSAPEMVKVCPVDTATKVPVDMVVNVTFSTNVQIINSSGITMNPEPGSGVHPYITGNVLWIYPPQADDWQDLAPNTKYTVTVPRGSIALAEDEQSSLTSDIVFSFQTGNALPEDIRYDVSSFVTKVEPFAKDDSYSVVMGSDLHVPYTGHPGLLDNDIQGGGTVKQAVLDAPQTTNGVEIRNYNPNDGSFDYTPAKIGDDTFTYKLYNGIGTSNSATVHIKVESVTNPGSPGGNTGQNNPPVANNDVYKVENGKTLIVDQANGVLLNDTDSDHDTLTAILVSPPGQGTLTLKPDGSFKYTPNSTFTGIDTFKYKANDSHSDSNEATVTITSDSPPIANPDNYTVQTGQTLIIDKPGVLVNDTDADGDTLTSHVVDNPSHGTLTLNSDGSLTYTPNTGFTGQDNFTYKANDGKVDSNIATVTVKVTSVPNDSGGDEGAIPGGGGGGTPESVQVPETPHVTTPNQVPQTPKVTVAPPEPVIVPVVTPKMPNTGVDPVDPVVGWPVVAGICLGILFILMAAKRKGLFSCK